jgi:hypothetical protein
MLKEGNKALFFYSKIPFTIQFPFLTKGLPFAYTSLIFKFSLLTSTKSDRYPFSIFPLSFSLSNLATFNVITLIAFSMGTPSSRIAFLTSLYKVYRANTK